MPFAAICVYKTYHHHHEYMTWYMHRQHNVGYA